MSKAYTKNEVKQKLLEHIKFLVDDWGSEFMTEKTIPERLNGLVHSILVAIDGESGSLPKFLLIADPHEEDKAFHVAKGNDYYVPRSEWWGDPASQNISGWLHDEFAAMKNK